MKVLLKLDTYHAKLKNLVFFEKVTNDLILEVAFWCGNSLKCIKV